MPIITLKHPAGALTPVTRDAIAHGLTDVLLRMEGGAATEGGKGFASVIFEPVDDGDWWVGGCTDDTYVTAPGRFLAHVTIPEGYMSQPHKSDVHAWVTQAVTDVLDPAGSGPATSIQVVIDEVTEGDWAAGGRTISLAHIADVVGLAKDGERFKWVKAYFKAKARAFATAGFPADCGGLLPESTDSTPP